MPTVALTDDQVLQLIEQLPTAKRVQLISRLANESAKLREESLRLGEAKMRELAAERGKHWDQMTDEDRIAFVDDLLHEDRECRP